MMGSMVGAAAVLAEQEKTEKDAAGAAEKDEAGAANTADIADAENAEGRGQNSKDADKGD